MASEKKKKEQAYKELQNEVSKKIYSYHAFDPKTKLLKNRKVAGDKLTEEDIHHFLKKITDAWNEAPIQSRVSFTARMFPAMKEFLKKYDKPLLMALLHDEPEGEPKN